MTDDHTDAYTCREELPPELRNHTFYRNFPTRGDLWRLADKRIAEIYGQGGVPHMTGTPDERDARHEQQRQIHDGEALKVEAAEWAEVIVSALPLRDRIQAAAPPTWRKRSNRVRVIDWSEPRLSDERHGPFLTCGESRDFHRKALAIGKTYGWAQEVRAEITWVHLLTDQPLHWHAIDARRAKRDYTEDNIICGAVLRVIEKAHRHAFGQARHERLVRDPQQQVQLSGKPSMAASLLMEITNAKVGCNRIAARNAFRLLGDMAEVFKKERTHV